MIAWPKFKHCLHKPLIIANILLAIALLLLIFAANFAGFIERWYSNGLFLLVCRVLHPLMNVFAISIGDLLLLVFVSWLAIQAVWLGTLFIKKQFKATLPVLLKTALVLQTMLLLFYLFWGMNYFRLDAAQRLGLEIKSYNQQQLERVTLTLIDTANACRAKLTRADTLQPDSQIYFYAEQAIQKLPGGGLPAVQSIRPKVKPSVLSFAMNYLTTEGYYNPITSEAQVNSQMPRFLKPVVACHEMAHQMGFATEDEANFIGFVAGISSGDRLLRYSAAYLGMTECMYAMRRQDSIRFKQLKARISAPVLQDLKTDRNYWKGYEGRLSWISGLFYDKYLKANHQPQGLNTYNQMVKLLIAWYYKSGAVFPSSRKCSQ